MALWKQEFHYNPHEEKATNKSNSAKRYIIVPVSFELAARIHAAAQQHNQPIEQYLEGILNSVVPPEEDAYPSQKLISQEWVEKLTRFQDELRKKHGGKPVQDSVEYTFIARVL
jgi:hypothetical protein